MQVNPRPSDGARSPLVDEALAHCLFSLIPAADIRRDEPPVLLKGEGVRVTDVHGRVFLDMLSSNTRASTLGFGNEEVARAMYDQARTLHYAGCANYASEPMIRLASTIARLAPGRLSKVAFASGGSEAVETALKLAKQYQQQSGRKPRAYKVISRWNAYHGSTMGALAVTDWLAVRDIFDPRLPGHSFVANPMRYRNAYAMGEAEYEDICVKHLERQILLEDPDLVAAFIGEPIMQANGVQVPLGDYWPRVREICTQHGIVMICDEVISGFGRTGHWFASAAFGVEPDMITMAKAMSGGYAPLGAVITTPEIADAVPHFRHVHTFAGHAVACAAANAVIGIKEREGLVDRARVSGARFGDALRTALDHHPIVGQVRGLGHWYAVDFTVDKRTRAPFKDDTVRAIVRRMWDHGVIASAIGTALEMAPPLIATTADLDQAVETCARAVHEIAQERHLLSA